MLHRSRAWPSYKTVGVRAIRVHLLQHLGEFAPHLGADLVYDKVFPHVITGFTDTSALLRDGAVPGDLAVVGVEREALAPDRFIAAEGGRQAN